MDFTKLIESLQARLGDVLPNLLGALAILVLGWIFALILRAVVRRGLGALRLNERLGSSGESAVDLEGGITSGAYGLSLLAVLIAFLDALNLEIVSAPLQGLLDGFFAFLPNLVAGGVLALVAVLVATLVRAGASRALTATNLDDRLASEAGVRPVSTNLATVLYWLVLLIFLPGVLGALEVRGLLAPVEGMLDEALAFLPNLFAAAMIGGVGWIVARILRNVVSNLLAATGADRVGARAGLSGNTTLSGLVGLIVYVLVLLPAATAALDALQLESVTAPATALLAAVTSALPNVFAAGVILTVAWLVAGFVSQLVRDLLAGAGFDAVPARMGLETLFTEAAPPSRLVAGLIVFFTMLFAAVEAAARLGFDEVADLVATFVGFGGQVLLGTVIIAVGFWLANLAHGAIERVHGDGSSALAGIARFAILGLVLAMGLRAMGLADDIVNLAFGLTLGAVAVAFALSFGLGGREAAGHQMDHWLKNLRGEGE